MVLWTIAIIMSLIFLALLMLVWLRKVQFDAIHHNFLSLEDEFGGQVVRGGFAIRPRFAGTYKGEDFSVSITSEKNGKERKYYIAIAMKSDSEFSFTIMSKEWLGNRELSPERQRDCLLIKDNQYLLEMAQSRNLGQLNIPLIENIVSLMHPFAYVLIGKSRMLLERASLNIIQDTRLASMKPLLEGMYQLKQAMG